MPKPLTQLFPKTLIHLQLVKIYTVFFTYCRIISPIKGQENFLLRKMASLRHKKFMAQTLVSTTMQTLTIDPQ